jgi:hypothetical protein
MIGQLRHSLPLRERSREYAFAFEQGGVAMLRANRTQTFPAAPCRFAHTLASVRHLGYRGTIIAYIRTCPKSTQHADVDPVAAWSPQSRQCFHLRQLQAPAPRLDRTNRCRHEVPLLHCARALEAMALARRILPRSLDLPGLLCCPSTPGCVASQALLLRNIQNLRAAALVVVSLLVSVPHAVPRRSQ